MKKRLYGVLIVMVLLTVVTSSLNSPISSFDVQDFVRESSKTTSTNPEEEVLVFMEENVSIHKDGSCELTLLMNVPSSPLAGVYRDFLGFPGDIAESNKTNIPDIVTFNDTVTVGDNVTHTVFNVINYSSIPVEEQFLNGVIQEHKHSFGIHINRMDMTAKMWGTDNACVVEVHATASLQVVRCAEIAIGPLNLNASYLRAGFILTKIGFIQQMLNSSSFEGKQRYNSTWITRFSLPDDAVLVSPSEREGWFQDFGGGTSLKANLTVVGNREIILTEKMVVTKDGISATPRDLLEDRFLCYRVFNIRYAMVNHATSNSPLTCCERKDVGGIKDDWDPGWGVDLMDEKFSLSIYNEEELWDVTLHLHSRLTLSGHVDWDFEWEFLKLPELQKFEAWTALEATIEAELVVSFGVEKTWEWEKLLIKRNKRFYFQVGIYLVELNLIFKATAKLAVRVVLKVEVTFRANATGILKAGVGWKRDKGWYPIHEADMDVGISWPPQFKNITEVTITPSVEFRLELLFYETAGPYIKFIPYVTLTMNPSSSPGRQYNITVGLEVSAGVKFGSWLKAILGLDEWDWPATYNYVFWHYLPPEERDVAVTDVRAPKKAFVTEPISVYVDVLNKGELTEDVNVTLSYQENGQWNQIGYQEFNNLKEGHSKTLTFDWNTTGRTNGNYPILANASIIGALDDKPEDNNRTDWVYLEVQNVAITNVTASPPLVDRGDPVNINVTVMNKGSVNVSALPVFAYYNSNLISDIWCEHMRMVFDLENGTSEIVSFTWDTTGVANGSYTISASATLLPHETNTTDNTKEANKTVTVSPSGILRRDIAIKNVTTSRQGWRIDINVTVKNEGDVPEPLVPPLYVTICADTIIIGTKNVTSLPPSIETTITFTWFAKGVPCGNYTISAYAPPVLNETDTTDNTCDDGWVVVTIVGDADGNGVVGWGDKTLLGLAWLASEGEPRYNPNADFDCSGVVSWGDKALLGINWLKTC